MQGERKNDATEGLTSDSYDHAVAQDMALMLAIELAVHTAQMSRIPKHLMISAISRINGMLQARRAFR